MTKGERGGEERSRIYEQGQPQRRKREVWGETLAKGTSSPKDEVVPRAVETKTVRSLSA